MRIGIASLMHESNTFVIDRTPLSAFERDCLWTGEAIRDRRAGTHHELGGFFDQLAEDRVEVVPLFAAWTMPSGTIEAGAAAELVNQMTRAFREAGPLDGVLLAPHGAAVADGELDFDGFWMTQLRELVGPAVPMIGTLDLHANLSERMLCATDALISYRSNPHLDQRDRGREAATLLVRTLRGECHPTSAAAFPPLVANIEAQATAESPCHELFTAADDIRRRRGVLAVSLNLGFPYADVPEMGVSVQVVTDDDRGLAQWYANELAGYWWQHRDEFQGHLIAPALAVRTAAVSPAPVCLLDMGDNVGGGGPGDGTLLVHELIRQGVGPSFACLNDPEAVQACHSTGVGGEICSPLGGKADDRHGLPLTGRFHVRALSGGSFEELETRHGGIRRFEQGPTAIVESERGVTLMLTSYRTAPFSLRQLTAFGIVPSRFRVLVAKGVHAPVAAYASACPTLLRVNTPGVTSADLSQFRFRHCRRRLYPFDLEFDWHA